MMKSDSRSRQGGAAAIEFALVFVLFFMVMYGAIAYGIVFAIKHSMTQAAAEGARAALKDVGNLTARMNLAKTTASDAVSWLGKQAPTPVVTSTVCSNPSYECVMVSLTYNYAANPIVPALPGLGIALPDTLYSQATVQLDAFY